MKLSARVLTAALALTYHVKASDLLNARVSGSLFSSTQIIVNELVQLTFCTQETTLIAPKIMWQLMETMSRSLSGSVAMLNPRLRTITIPPTALQNILQDGTPNRPAMDSRRSLQW